MQIFSPFYNTIHNNTYNTSTRKSQAFYDFIMSFAVYISFLLSFFNFEAYGRARARFFVLVQYSFYCKKGKSWRAITNFWGIDRIYLLSFFFFLVRWVLEDILCFWSFVWRINWKWFQILIENDYTSSTSRLFSLLYIFICSSQTEGLHNHARICAWNFYNGELDQFFFFFITEKKWCYLILH